MTPYSVPLRVRLMFGSSSRLALAIVAFAFIAYQTSKRSGVESFEGRARATAFSLAQRTTVGLRNQLRALTDAAADPAVIAALRSGVASPEARKVLERLPPDTLQTVAVGLRSASGGTVLSLGPELPSWAFDESARPDTVHFGRLVARGDSARYEVVAPVFDGSTLLGSVVRVRRLTATAASVRVLSDLLGAGGELMFGNRDGSLWTDVVRPIEGPGSPQATRYRRDGREFIVASYPIDVTPFVFAVGFPEDVALAPVRSLLWTFGSIGAAIIGLGMLTSWWANGRVTRPLTELAAAAESITARHSPGPAAAPTGGDELSRLQRAFASMEASVQTAHADLQQQVEERTVALDELTEERSRLERTLGQLERSEAALRLADRRKDHFLATLAHELRNPLAPIRNAVQILKIKGAPNPEVQWGHDVIDRQVAQMSRLLDELLDVSRISHDRLELRKERIDLAAVVQHAVETSRPLIDAGNHELSIDLPAEPVILDADPVRLAQVFANLLNNSAKYTDAGGHIRIAARRQGDGVVVSVTDDGIGIAPDALLQVFERFSQAPSSQERSQRGLGLGLSLVRGLVELHGGHVVGSSAGLGQGSQFTVRLPIAPEQTPLTPSGAPEPAEVESPKRRLLIADDLEDSADSLAQWLRLNGHDVVTAYHGQQAIAVAAQTRPDVVLLDLGMPTMDGYEACRRIRSETWGREMVVIALTGWGQARDRRRTEEAGFDFHMVKPVDPSALLALLASTVVVGTSRH